MRSPLRYLLFDLSFCCAHTFPFVCYSSFILFFFCSSSSILLFVGLFLAAQEEGRAVVFVHGIGVGFAHYLRLLARLPRTSACYLVEWPHVCMQVVEDVAPVDATVAALAGLLRADGHDSDGGDGGQDARGDGRGGATFVGHSLGSTCVAWMLHDPAARRLVKAAVLLDPVTFLLMDPGIAYNFLHRPPASVLEVFGALPLKHQPYQLLAPF